MSELEADDETLYCYRHPGRETALRCSSCDRPICTDCAVAAPVGIKCPECARLPRAARAGVPAARLARGIVAGCVLAVVGAFVYWFVGQGLFAFLIGIGIGIVIAEGVRWATGGFRDHRVAQIAAAATIAAVAGPSIIGFAFRTSGAVSAPTLAYSLVAAAVGAVYAYNRVN